MTIERNIVLTGPPGSGKSVVGRKLARLLDRAFVDMDAEIESRLGLTIAEIFSTRGEDAFRDAESEMCRELSRRSGLVVAAGGGAILRPENREALSSSLLVNLRAGEDDLVRRTEEKDRRPLILGDPAARRARLVALLDERREAYDSVPVQVDTTGLNVDEVARRIVEVIAP